ncbi:ROK family transcriptional regulator [Actinoplanes sp. N902-109]|uniref:ROK family transcriptional regulator n=1 Tax=Actinoplanes sp. (strain N902-109) TaxID=649831 RepID=UPI001E350641|nr:ROK family transcriptional regulator [Actinoplanes sp. N902-109]
MRRQNLGAVLRYVHVHGPTSRAELTTSLGLNRSTIGALATDLTASGLVTEEAPTVTRRAGRPSLVVSPRSAAVYALALSIEADLVRAARVGLGGRILDVRDAPRPRGSTLLGVVPLLAGLARELTPEGDTLCAGGAVAVADTTRADDGTLDVGVADEGLTAALEAALVVPFELGDLADLAALAEHTRGVAAGIDDVVYLHGDVGVSAGIVTGGRLIVGHRGHSGKVGHMVVNPSGRRCGCGSRGCWETEIGTDQLLRLAATPAGDRPGAERPGFEGLPGFEGRLGNERLGNERLAPMAACRQVIAAAEGGDARARAALDRVGDWLGFGVANLVNVFNPDIVVFGGTLSTLVTAGWAAIHRRLDSMALPASREHLQVRASALGADAALIGAAELAFEPLLTDPLSAAAARVVNAPIRPVGEQPPGTGHQPPGAGQQPPGTAEQPPGSAEQRPGTAG